MSINIYIVYLKLMTKIVNLIRVINEMSQLKNQKLKSTTS